MSEHSEHPSQQPPERPAEAAPHATPPPAEGDVIGTAPPAGGPPAPAGPSRFRRWSGNASVRTGAVALVAGLVGGLAGGGIVAAFSDDGHDHAQPVRFERGMPPGFPEFRGPRYWAPRGPGNAPYPRPPQAPQQAPTPSPRATG
jgi:hypothetical protein